MKKTQIVDEDKLIAAIGYDKAEQEMDVEFTNGITYRYFNIPNKVYKELMKAPCLHRYMNLNIKSVYPYKSLGNQQF